MSESLIPLLIILSVCIAIISSYITLVLIGRIFSDMPSEKGKWILMGAVAFGLGIFSIHFIGMMAFSYNNVISYNPYMLAVSLSISIGTPMVAFYCLYNGALSRAKLIAGGFFISIGSVVSHFSAVWAIEGQIKLELHSVFLLLSLLSSIVFSVISIRIFSDIKKVNRSIIRRALSSIVLGITLSLMHYIAMDATAILPLTQMDPELSKANFILAVLIICIVMVLLFAFSLLALFDYRSLQKEKRLFLKIKESEGRFHRLVELSPEPIMVCSGWELAFTNEAFLKMIQVADEKEVIGKPISEFIPEELQESALEYITMLSDGEKTKPREQQLLTPAGLRLDVEVTGAKMEFEGKLAIQLVLRDITEQKRVGRKLEESQQRYRSLFEHHPDGVYSKDCTGNLTSVNRSLEELVGFSKEELLRMSFHPIIHPDYLEMTNRKFIEALEGKPLNYEILGLHKDGTTIPLNITNLPIYVDGEMIGVYGIVKNISSEKEALRLLADKEEKYRSLFAHNLDAVFEIDLSGAYRNANERAAEMTHYSIEELSRLNPVSLVADNLNVVYEAFESVKAGQSLHLETKLNNKSNALIEVEANVVPISKQGKVDGAFAIIRDVTEKKEIQKKVHRLAFTDQLTGLPNRHWFYENLISVVERAKKRNDSVAILIVDFDDFKGINDLLGHYGGDLFLKEVAGRLKACLRPNDHISRYGGDEFVMVLEGVEEAYIKRLAQKILRVMNQPIYLMDHELTITISIGISMQNVCANNEETLIRQADFAMYSAKEKGKNNYQFFTQDLNDKVTRKLQLEGALRKAVEKEAFELYYQPQIELQSMEVAGVEALIRWNSPFGFISPAEFIPIAEETGLILPIGEWVIKEACRQIKCWEKAGLPRIKVSVNVSARQFKDPALSRKIQEILMKYQVNPIDLAIEITESVMLDIEASSKVIEEIKALGVKVAIDDFGAGYSSLNVIKNVEIDTLKIDKSLIDDVISNHRNFSILSAIIGVGKSLDTEIIVEGIETKEQVTLLQEFQVVGQGYYFSRPCTAEQIEAMWQKQTIKIKRRFEGQFIN